MMLTGKLSSIIRNNNVQLEDTFMYYLYNNKEPIYQHDDVRIYQMINNPPVDEIGIQTQEYMESHKYVNPNIK